MKNCIHVKIILKNVIQRKKLTIRLLAVHCLQIAHLMQQKISLIVTEAKIVWKSFVKAMRIVNYEKKMIPLTGKEIKSKSLLHM